MNNNEIMTLDVPSRTLSLEDTSEVCKGIITSVQQVIKQDYEVVKKQNEVYTNILNNLNSPEDRYKDALFQANEILKYKKELRRDVLGTATIIILALCGVKAVNISR